MKAQGGKTSDHIQVTTTGLVINANIGRWRHYISNKTGTFFAVMVGIFQLLDGIACINCKTNSSQDNKNKGTFAQSIHVIHLHTLHLQIVPIN
jgi:hypothetical protein